MENGAFLFAAIASIKPGRVVCSSCFLCMNSRVLRSRASAPTRVGLRLRVLSSSKRASSGDYEFPRRPNDREPVEAIVQGCAGREVRSRDRGKPLSLSFCRRLIPAMARAVSFWALSASAVITVFVKSSCLPIIFCAALSSHRSPSPSFCEAS
ncbi:MAG: hypothetical protein PWQ29_1370, partial [Verrucomicrobiota bacterium]|nr:hypothetical protein [Verrucomicrobiota bacterium]